MESTTLPVLVNSTSWIAEAWLRVGCDPSTAPTTLTTRSPGLKGRARAVSGLSSAGMATAVNRIARREGRGEGMRKVSLLTNRLILHLVTEISIVEKWFCHGSWRVVMRVPSCGHLATRL